LWDDDAVHRLELPPDLAQLPPKTVGRLVTEDLARVLPGEWRTNRDGLRRVDGPQLTELTLQRSTYSRAGQAVWIYPRLTVRDARLLEWQRTDTDRSSTRLDDRIFNSLFINFSSVNSVEIPTSHTGPGDGGDTAYGEFVALLMDDILPTRERLKMPETLLDLPERWLWDVRGMVEWCASEGRSDLCWALVARSVGEKETTRASFLRGFQAGRRGESEDSTNSFASLGHLMEGLDTRFGLTGAPVWAQAAAVSD
jgi:hypothetical protein